ncbi:MAG: molybdenum cofactor biosynthesis protein MoaE [Gordonia sp. (in: high G+C Gram-positive bacteria)]
MPGAVVVHTAVADDAIALADHEAMVRAAADGHAGAVVGFVGAVRDHDGGKGVRRLSYSAHPSAPAVLAQVVGEVVAAVDGVRAVAVSHRVGDLEIGDVAFVVAVAADHRGPAFAVCADLVDEVKARVPVWKQQFFTDGTDEWVGVSSLVE